MCQICNPTASCDSFGHEQGCPMSPDVSDWAEGALAIADRHYINHIFATDGYVEITTPDTFLRLDTAKHRDVWHLNDMFDVTELWRMDDGNWVVWGGDHEFPLMFYVVL